MECLSQKGLLKLKETVSTKEYDLVIIDSLKKVTAGTGFRYDHNEEMMLLMRLLTGIITPYSSLLILHHSNKADSLGMNSIGGASAIGEIVDSVHKLSRKDEHNDDSNYTFETIKIRNGYHCSKFNYSRDDDGNYRVHDNDPTGSKQAFANASFAFSNSAQRLVSRTEFSVPQNLLKGWGRGVEL